MGNSASSASLPALQTVSNCETAKFMGTWFVHGVKPTFLEKTNSNAVEVYSLAPEGKKHDIDIDFTYNSKEPITSPIKSAPQKGWVVGDDKKNSGNWKVQPFWPAKLDYLILECSDDYDYCVIGYPSRAYAWIMARKPVMDDDTFNTLKEKLENKHNYSLEGFRRVPQKWTKSEREKRGLVDVIPDDILSKEE
jgi:apolipoprotein D and lipocalin family protein